MILSIAPRLEIHRIVSIECGHQALNVRIILQELEQVLKLSVVGAMAAFVETVPSLLELNSEISKIRHHRPYSLNVMLLPIFVNSR